jgi:hypothetical protein
MSTNDLTVFFGFRLLRWTRRARALIVRLLLGCRPTDVSRLVIAVIINAIDGMVNRGRLTDVIVKGEKVVFPFVTHDNASAAVIAEGSASGPIASFFNRCPDPIDVSSAHVVLNPTDSFVPQFFEFRYSGGAKHFFVQTTARGSVASGQVAGHYPKCVSARTLAEPVDASSVRLASALWSSNYGESAKYRIS